MPCISVLVSATAHDSHLDGQKVCDMPQLLMSEHTTVLRLPRFPSQKLFEILQLYPNIPLIHAYPSSDNASFDYLLNYGRKNRKEGLKTLFLYASSDMNIEGIHNVLSSLTSLTKLSFKNWPPCYSTISFLSVLSKLETLEIELNNRDSSCKFDCKLLSDLQNLKSLSIYHYSDDAFFLPQQYLINNVDALLALKKLETIDIDWPLMNEYKSMSPTSSLSPLNCSFLDLRFFGNKNFPNLRSLHIQIDITENKKYFQKFKLLGAAVLSNLESLTIIWSEVLEITLCNTHVFQGMHSLKRFSLGGISTNGQSFYVRSNKDVKINY